MKIEKSVALDMLTEGLTRAVVFDEQGKMEQPSSVFRKRGLVVHRCSLTRDNPEMERMLASTGRMLKREAPQLEHEPLAILEMSVAGVLNEPDQGREGARSRMDWLVRPRHAALVTNYAETFHISGFLRRYTADPVRFVTGLDGVVTMVREQFYTGVTGGVLEGLGRLYAPDVKVCVFSMPAGVFWQRLARHGVERAALFPHHPRKCCPSPMCGSRRRLGTWWTFCAKRGGWWEWGKTDAQKTICIALEDPLAGLCAVEEADVGVGGDGAGGLLVEEVEDVGRELEGVAAGDEVVVEAGGDGAEVVQVGDIGVDDGQVVAGEEFGALGDEETALDDEAAEGVPS